MSSLEKNPFLKHSPLKDRALCFDEINTEHFMPALEKLCQKAELKFSEIIDNKQDPSYENTIKPFHEISNSVVSLLAVFHQLNSSVSSPDLMALMNPISSLVQKTFPKMTKNPKFFKRVETIYKSKKQRELLSDEQNRYLEVFYEQMVLNGALLEEKDRKRLMQIGEELSLLGNKFSQNMINFQKKFRFFVETKEDLKGLPESLCLEAEKLAKKERKKGFSFTALITSYVPFLKHCKKRELREKFYKLMSSRNYKDEFDNSEMVVKQAGLRLEMAQLLGFSNYSEYRLKTSMAKSPQKVMSFLEDLLTAYQPKALEDLEELKVFAKREDGIDELKPWDVQYYSEKLSKKEI